MANYPIKLLKDETNAAFVPLVSTDCIRDKDNQTLQQILDKKLNKQDRQKVNKKTLYIQVLLFINSPLYKVIN